MVLFIIVSNLKQFYMFSDGLFQLNYGMEDKQPLKIAL